MRSSMFRNHISRNVLQRIVYVGVDGRNKQP
jgi:hypothetical protein